MGCCASIIGPCYDRGCCRKEKKKYDEEEEVNYETTEF